MTTHIVWLLDHGYAGLFGLLAVGIMGLPIPDETLLTLAGYLVATNRWQLSPVMAASGLGSACGMTVNYILGRTLGNRLLQRCETSGLVGAGQTERVRRWFDRAGRWGLTFGYFVPGVRHLMPLVAGSTKLPFAQFALFTYAGACLWSATFVAIGFHLGEHWPQAMQQFQRHRLLTVGSAAVLLVLYALFRSRTKSQERH